MQDVKSEFYSFNFNEAIEGFLTIDEIKGTKIKSNKGKIEIKAMSADGLRFTTDLRFPVRNDIKYGLSANILEQNIKLKGVVENKEEKEKEGLIEYQIKFDFVEGIKKEKLQQELVQLVNALQITKRHGKKRGHTYLQSLQKAY